MSMPECGLNQSKVPSPPVEFNGKRMAHGVDGEVTFDASLIQPVFESELHLASTEWASVARGEKRIVRAETCGTEVAFQGSADG